MAKAISCWPSTCLATRPSNENLVEETAARLSQRRSGFPKEDIVVLSKGGGEGRGSFEIGSNVV